MSKRQTITIRDIAQRANVSYQTVSLVINNKPGVSDGTRKRILALMDELDYHPNRVAQMLNSNQSKTLELILVDVLNGGRLADSTKIMAHTAKQIGYSLLVSETEEATLGAAMSNAAARLVDGVILYGPRLRISDDKLLQLANGLPLVRRDYMPGSKLAWVGFDQVYATRLATEHLIELGHRQIACVPPVPELINGYWRLTAWQNVLREHGLEPGPTVAGDYSMKSGYEAAVELARSGKPFTGLVIGTDTMAMGVLRGLREAGLRVPQDISVVSLDNSELASYTEPALTTVDFQFSKQDEMAVRFLIEIINTPSMELHQRVLTPTGLVTRESTRRL